MLDVHCLPSESMPLPIDAFVRHCLAQLNSNVIASQNKQTEKCVLLNLQGVLFYFQRQNT